MPIPLGPGAGAAYLPHPDLPDDDSLTPPDGVAVSEFTMRWYEGLPQVMRATDLPYYHLLRYISLLGDEAQEVDDLWERFNFTPLDEGGQLGDTADLVDPTTADSAWLPWLAQFAGVRLPRGLSDAAARDAIRYAPAGWRAGTKGAIADAARSALTGTRYVGVYDHTTDSSSIGAGGQWDVLLVTRADETPDAAAVIAAVVAKEAKPAGVTLWHRTFSATWTAIEAAYPTWAARDGKTWLSIEETGL